jgi:TatD DNase family protein
MIDSHAHLTLPQFDDDRNMVIRRALDAGLTHIITVGIDVEDCKKALDLSQQHEIISVSVGIHPHDTKSVNTGTYDALKAFAKQDRVVAIGEIGLDFYRNLSPQETQVRSFREQLQVAREVSLPVIIHDREAHREIVEILQQEKADEIGGVIHCFSGDWAMAKTCMDMGFYISIPGTVTFKASGTYQDLVRKIPLDRMLIETDCPFLTPHPYRGKRNEPARVRIVAEAIARIKDRKVEEIGEHTARNTRKLFRLFPNGNGVIPERTSDHA